jgi:hypothetical protein
MRLSRAINGRQFAISIPFSRYGMPDATAEMLEDIAGSVEEAARIAGWAREQVKVAGALFGDNVSDGDRRRILAAELRKMAADCCELPQPWEDRRILLNGLADLLDPDGDGIECLVFGHRRAGNPRAKCGIERGMIAMEANRLYRRYVAEGRNRRGLKKRVSDEIGRWFGKQGATIDKLWQPLPPNQPLRAAFFPGCRNRARG